MARVVKRLLDVTLAGIGLVMTSPIIALAAVGVRLDSRGPAIYTSTRVGRHGTRFRMYKLRTMEVGSDQSGPAITTAGDSRVTRFGRVLRRTKLDELPQLFNVLKGDMSLVGPRPEHPDFVRLYDDRQRLVLSVRPGITSSASVRFHDEEQLLEGADIEGDYVRGIMPAKLELDLRYAEHPSLGADLSILAKTASVMIKSLLRLSRRPSSKRG